jgi:hypothetical protein
LKSEFIRGNELLIGGGRWGEEAGGETGGWKRLKEGKGGGRGREGGVVLFVSFV